MLKAYSDIDWRAKPLILCIKHWAQYHDINDASRQTLSSYSLALMGIYYMQSIICVMLFYESFDYIYINNSFESTCFTCVARDETSN